MRRYDDPVDVVRGQVGDIEAPAQFVWRTRLWRVCAVVSHWVETGPWWEHADVHDLLGVRDGRDGGEEASTSAVSVASLLGERDVWRVEAARGRLGSRAVVDLSFDWATGEWRLVRCLD
jgi:hypothetical protein